MLNFKMPPAEAPLATNVVERIGGRDHWRRWTQPNFLHRCAPLIADVHRYWDSKRRGRRMPARADIDPAELRPYIANMLLVDVGHEPFALTYRLVGTREVKARGGDPTGKDVASHFIGDSWDAILFKYRFVVEQRAFIYDEDPAPTASPRARDGLAVSAAVARRQDRQHGDGLHRICLALTRASPRGQRARAGPRII